MARSSRKAYSPSLSKEDEDILIVNARQDPLAFTELYNAYVVPVYRYLYSRTGNRDDAEDLTAQVFLAALEGLPGYRHNGHFAAWLFTIAHNKAMDHYRCQRREAPISLARQQPGPGPDLLDSMIQSEGLENLMRHIRRMNEQEQELLQLRFVACLGFREIALILYKNEAAIKKQYYRLLARLESQMEEKRE